MTEPAPLSPPPILGADWSPAEPGVTRRLAARGQQLMAMQVRFERGARGARHDHPHEQLTLVLSGTFEFVLGDTRHTLHVGDSLSIPGGVPHEALAVSDGELLDMFTPVREDLVGP